CELCRILHWSPMYLRSQVAFHLLLISSSCLLTSLCSFSLYVLPCLPWCLEVCRLGATCHRLLLLLHSPCLNSRSRKCRPAPVPLLSTLTTFSCEMNSPHIPPFHSCDSDARERNRW